MSPQCIIAIDAFCCTGPLLEAVILNWKGNPLETCTVVIAIVLKEWLLTGFESYEGICEKSSSWRELLEDSQKFLSIWVHPCRYGSMDVEGHHNHESTQLRLHKWPAEALADNKRSELHRTSLVMVLLLILINLFGAQLFYENANLVKGRTRC